MSDNSVNPSNESNNNYSDSSDDSGEAHYVPLYVPTSPTPSHSDLATDSTMVEVATIPEGPLSPRSIAGILQSNLDLDNATLRGICAGLVTTLRDREEDHAAQHAEGTRRASALERRTAELEGEIRGFIRKIERTEKYIDPPVGYVENTGQVSEFYIPYGDNTYRPAKWIQQLPDGKVAGFSTADCANDDPWIIDVYATPEQMGEEDIDPRLPLPVWLVDLLSGPSVKYQVLKDRVSELDEWGILADVHRYRECEDKKVDIENQIQTLQAHLRGIGSAQELCRGRLEAAQLAKKVGELVVLVNDRSTRRSAWFNPERRRVRGRGRPT